MKRLFRRIAAISIAVGLAAGAAAAPAEKAFRRDDLADQAVRLEAQIKTESGAVSKSAPALKADADAAFKRNDFRSGLVLLGQIATVAPQDSGNWLKIARTIFQ